MALGYTPKHIKTYSNGVMVFRPLSLDTLESYHYEFLWHTFDYRDWNVISPIAEKYNCFPILSADKNTWVCPTDYKTEADTPQKAIALAIINS